MIDVVVDLKSGDLPDGRDPSRRFSKRLENRILCQDSIGILGLSIEVLSRRLHLYMYR